MASGDVGPTLIDVFDHALDGDITAEAASKLRDAELAELLQELQRFRENADPSPANPDEWRVCLGMHVHQPIGALVADEVEIGRVMSSEGYKEAWDVQRHQRAFAAALLYGHSLVANDPLDGCTDLEQVTNRQWLYRCIGHLGELAPLIRDSVLILVPAWSRYRERHADIVQRARYIVGDPLWHNPDDESARTVRDWQPAGEADPLAFQEALQVAGVDMAASAGARFLPWDRASWQHYEYRLSHTQVDLRARKVDFKVIPALAAAGIPLLRASPQALAEIRRDEASFAAWRSSLRTVIKTIEQRPYHDVDFELEARGTIEDFLQPAAAEVRRATARSRVMTRIARQSAGRLLLGGALATGAAAATGGSAGAALAGSGAGALSAGILDAVFRPKPSGAAAVIARLVDDTSGRVQTGP